MDSILMTGVKTAHLRFSTSGSPPASSGCAAAVGSTTLSSSTIFGSTCWVGDGDGGTRTGSGVSEGFGTAGFSFFLTGASSVTSATTGTADGEGFTTGSAEGTGVGNGSSGASSPPSFPPLPSFPSLPPLPSPSPSCPEELPLSPVFSFGGSGI